MPDSHAGYAPDAFERYDLQNSHAHALGIRLAVYTISFSPFVTELFTKT